MKKCLISCLCLWILLIGSVYGDNSKPESTIKIGYITELSGSLHDIGLASKNAAVLAVQEINNAGGIKIGDTNYKIDLVIADSNSSPTQAAKVARKLITEDHVVALIGPNASRDALPVSIIAEQYHIAMITPWASGANITINQKTNQPKQYVFRVCFNDTEEATEAATFARRGLHAKKAAVLFDEDFPYIKEGAAVFTKTFTKLGGTIVASQNFGGETEDFNEILTQIKNAAPEVIYMPSYYSSVAPILNLARQIGITAPFIGSDGWGNLDSLTLCGPACVGSYVINHYSPDSTNELTKKFINDYQTKYDVAPNDVAALTYDAFQLLKQALQNAASTLDPQTIRMSLAQIRKFNGVTGTMYFTGKSGDPIKTGTIIKIKGSSLDSPI